MISWYHDMILYHDIKSWYHIMISCHDLRCGRGKAAATTNLCGVAIRFLERDISKHDIKWFKKNSLASTYVQNVWKRAIWSKNIFFCKRRFLAAWKRFRMHRLGDRSSRGQLGSKQLATSNQGHLHIRAVLSIQARKRVFWPHVVGRQADLDRDPLQTGQFAATKGLTAQTLAPDDAQGRSRQVKAGQGRSGQVKAGQVKSG